jgi:hypothetical protein
LALRLLPTVAALLLSAGCAHLVTSPAWPGRVSEAVLVGGTAADLPGRTTLTAGQLLIHADFPLAGQHRLVRELEAMRAEVSQQLGLPISDEPINLYLFESPARYQAFVAARFPTLPPRRAFFVETDTTLSIFAAWQDRVAEDLRHETAHGYVHSVVPAVPLWLDEGIAEYFERPHAEQGRHGPHLAHLAGRLIEGTWRPDLSRMERLESAGEMSQDHYAEAWCWVHWLLHTTPDRRALLEDYLADLRRDPETAPLSVRLRQAEGDVPADVLRHVESLSER